MGTAELRKRVKADIDGLSGPGLRLAAEFLAFVRERGSSLDAATEELLAIPGFRASFERGKRDVEAGRVTPWRGVGKPKRPTRKSRGSKAGRDV